MLYKPDDWVMVKLTNINDKLSFHYRIFATWGGSYLHGASWKLNSGVTTVKPIKDFYEFEGSSGSVYRCRKNSYRLSSYGASVLRSLAEQNKEHVTIETLDESTDFTSLDYK